CRRRRGSARRGAGRRERSARIRSEAPRRFQGAAQDRYPPRNPEGGDGQDSAHRTGPEARADVTSQMALDAGFCDLDGTLTDPKSGITLSIQYAMTKRERAAPAAHELYSYIGPPLR